MQKLCASNRVPVLMEEPHAPETTGPTECQTAGDLLTVQCGQ